VYRDLHKTVCDRVSLTFLVTVELLNCEAEIFRDVVYITRYVDFLHDNVSIILRMKTIWQLKLLSDLVKNCTVNVDSLLWCKKNIESLLILHDHIYSVIK